VTNNKFLPKEGDIVSKVYPDKNKKYIWIEFESGIAITVEDFSQYIKYPSSDNFFDDEGKNSDIFKTL
jgi:hypothetical protein